MRAVFNEASTYVDLPRRGHHFYDPGVRIQDSQVHHTNVFILGLKDLSFSIRPDFNMENFPGL